VKVPHTDELFDMDPETRQVRERRPLADRMRPQSLEEFVGQEHLLSPGKVLFEAMGQGKLFPMIFWGPPGCGKTALAFLLSHSGPYYWVSFSAVLSGVKEIREILRLAEHQWHHYGKQTLLFVDEIHRFNKAQQDAFLPHVEKGRLLLVGATTENPSFEINKALLSRTRVLVLHPLSENDIARIINRALQDAEKGLGKSGLSITADGMAFLCNASQGDARRALNTLELAESVFQRQKRPDHAIGETDIREALQKKGLLYDKTGEEHYNLISAFIKSLRGSDPDAALYWMVRMLEGGEDPLFIVRRMIVFASEDIGNADPTALSVAVSAKEAVHFVGLPEACLNLSQAVTYLASAPKSNASCVAYSQARKAALEHGSLPVPLHLRNAPTGLMRDLGYGKGYQYPHDSPEGIVSEDYLPGELAGKIFYQPTNRGYEQKIRERLARWRDVTSKRSEKK